MDSTTDDDYGERKGEEFVEYPAEIQVASEGVSPGERMRSKKGFHDELGRLLG